MRAAQLVLGAVLRTAVMAMVATFTLWWSAAHPSSVTQLVLGLVYLALVIVLAPVRIVRAVLLGRRLRSAASGAAIINPSAQRAHGRHRA